MGSSLVLIGIIVIILLSRPVLWLTAQDSQSGAFLGAWRLDSASSFSVEYIHSVQLTPVIETYHIDPEGRIILDETIFHSYGAGLPATTPYDFEMTKDYFRIYNIHMVMESLVYRTGAVRAAHQLVIGQKTIPFLDFSEPRQAVLFRANRAPLFKYIIEEVIQ